MTLIIEFIKVPSVPTIEGGCAFLFLRENMNNSLCLQLDSKTSIIDLSNCYTNCPEIDCLVDAISCTGCPVIPSWDNFQQTLNNPTIITNLETDGNYATVPDLIKATEADLLAVVGIGPASITAIEAALATYNLVLST